ncbi:MAG: UDP-N-acetylmuramate dehydrogenase [Bacteroidota bacterium]
MSIQAYVSLKSLNTFGVKAQARYYSCIKDTATLRGLLLQEKLKILPKLVVGSGSNILFVGNFGGWVIQMAIGGIEKLQEGEAAIWLKVGAGVSWHTLVLYCVEQGYGGIENLSLIPGTVGAAPIQNIGAYGVELSEVFESLEAMEVNTGVVKTFSKQACAFGYRDSIFKNTLRGRYIILNVTLRLQKQPTFRTAYGSIRETLAAMQVRTLSIKAISAAVIHIRQSKLPDPAKLGNAGSFFRNPMINRAYFEQLKSKYPILPGYALEHDQVKLPAAWLIEQCGWRGYRRGPAGVHSLQALVLVNYGGATGQAIYQLAQDIQQSVKERFNIELIPEVSLVM